MQRRHFLAGGLGVAALPLTTQAQSMRQVAGPVLLTLSGAIAHSNRDALNPTADLLMSRQGIQFDKAFTFDFGALSALPAHEIKPTLEYDGHQHRLKGPRLADVLALVGAHDDNATEVIMKAVDGYSASLSLGEVRAAGYIVATHMDGMPLPLGGLGPLWVIYDADTWPANAGLPLPDRFSRCPWACYHIAVAAPAAPADAAPTASE